MDPVFDYIYAILGTVLVVASLWITVRHFKIARAVSYIERFNSPNMIEVRSKVDSWIASDENEQEKISALSDDHDLKVALLTFINLFVELGIAYKYKLIHRRVTFDIWVVLVPEYWDRLRFFVSHERSRGRHIGYSFELLAREIKEQGSVK